MVQLPNTGLPNSVDVAATAGQPDRTTAFIPSVAPFRIPDPVGLPTVLPGTIAVHYHFDPRFRWIVMRQRFRYFVSQEENMKEKMFPLFPPPGIEPVSSLAQRHLVGISYH